MVFLRQYFAITNQRLGQDKRTIGLFWPRFQSIVDNPEGDHLRLPELERVRHGDQRADLYLRTSEFPLILVARGLSQFDQLARHFPRIEIRGRFGQSTPEIINQIEPVAGSACSPLRSGAHVGKARAIIVAAGDAIGRQSGCPEFDVPIKNRVGVNCIFIIDVDRDIPVPYPSGL